MRAAAHSVSTALAFTAVGLGLAAAVALVVRLSAFGVSTVAVALAAYLTLSACVLIRFARVGGEHAFGLANSVTLVRGALACLLLALVVQPDALGAAPGVAAGWLFVAVALGSLALDGVDGWVARRCGLVTPFGARFDVEVDALLAWVLALAGVVLGKIGLWVLALPAMYHAFLLARLAWPVLAKPLPRSMRRKTVFVVQAAALLAVAAPPVTPSVATALGGAALLLVLASFACDIVWLGRHRSDDPFAPLDARPS